MKSLLIAAALTFITSNLAIAGQCQDDIQKIDSALATQEIDADLRVAAEDMRNQAVQLCGAGNEEEGLDVTSEAKALLSIE